MKGRVFPIDRIVNEIIQSPRFSSFTITALRLEYMRRMPEHESISVTKVRRYVYKQVKRLVHVGWAARDGKPMSRDAQYLVLPIPDGMTLTLTEPMISRKHVSEIDIDSPNIDQTSSPITETQPLNEIESRLNKVRMDFIATLGEAETYKAILTDHPCLRGKLEGSYHVSREQSSNLMGQLRALEQTVKILVSHK